MSLDRAIYHAETLVESAKEYIEIKAEQIKIDAAEKTSAVLSYAISTLFVLFFVFMGSAFIAIGCALVLAKYTGSYWSAFFIIGVLILFKTILIRKLRRRFIQLPVMNKIISLLHNEKYESDSYIGRSAK